MQMCSRPRSRPSSSTDRLQSEEENDVIHLHYKLQFLAMRNQSAFVSLTEEPPDGLAAFLAVIERPMVHIHAHELVREVAAHDAGELQRVLHRLGAMVEAVTNARGENVRDRLARRRIVPFMNNVAAEGQGKAEVLATPPRANVFAHDQPFILIGELA